MKLNYVATLLPFQALLVSALPARDEASSEAHGTISGPKEAGTFDSFQALASQRSLLLLKERLGPAGLHEIFKSDIEESNKFWHTVVANSTSGSWIPSTARVIVEGPGLTEAAFTAWFGADTGDANKLLRAHPEHYDESVTADPVTGVLVADILEAWAGRVTYYKIPEYGAPNRTAHPFLEELSDFPAQFSGEGVLQDGTGTVFAVVHNSFRDSDSGKGVEALLTVWVRGATPEDVIEGMRQHQAVEFTNWLSNAQKDIASGKFQPPS